MGRYRYEIFDTGDTKAGSKKKSIPARSIDAFVLRSSGHHQKQRAQSCAVDHDLLNKLKTLTCLSVLFIPQESTEQ